MIRIPVNRAFSDSFPLPMAAEVDVLVYTIYKQSDDTVFATGNLTFSAGIHWKVTFTPTTLNEQYFIEVVDAAGDVIYSQTYEAVGRTVEVPSSTTLDTTAAGMLAAVNTAIASNLAGGAVQSYSIAGRNVQRMSLTELYALRDKLQREVNIAYGPRRNYAGF